MEGYLESKEEERWVRKRIEERSSICKYMYICVRPSFYIHGMGCIEVSLMYNIHIIYSVHGRVPVKWSSNLLIYIII